MASNGGEEEQDEDEEEEEEEEVGCGLMAGGGGGVAVSSGMGSCGVRACGLGWVGAVSCYCLFYSVLRSCSSRFLLPACLYRVWSRCFCGLRAFELEEEKKKEK